MDGPNRKLNITINFMFQMYDTLWTRASGACNFSPLHFCVPNCDEPLLARVWVASCREGCEDSLLDSAPGFWQGVFLVDWCNDTVTEYLLEEDLVYNLTDTFLNFFLTATVQQDSQFTPLNLPIYTAQNLRTIGLNIFSQFIGDLHSSNNFLILSLTQALHSLYTLGLMQKSPCHAIKCIVRICICTDG